MRAGSRIRTWSRWAHPGIGTANRSLYLRIGAVGAGLASGYAFALGSGLSGTNNELELLNTTTALSSNGATKQSTIHAAGLHTASASNGSYATSINFTNPWEIAFSGASCAETAQTGVTATWSGGVATFSFTAHGYAVGDKIVNTAFTPAGYNGTLIVTGAAANTWTAAIASDPGGAGTGGTTTRTSNVTLVDYYVEWLQ